MLKPPQRWAVRAAAASVLAGLGPVAWRLHMLVWGAGWDLAPQYRSSASSVAYVLGLVVVEGAASIAVLGLVRPWGERWPRWVPRLKGRRIPPRLVVGIASTGAVLLTVIIGYMMPALIVSSLKGYDNPILQVHGWHRAFMLAHYLWWPLWPAGLWVAIFGYARRWAS